MNATRILLIGEHLVDNPDCGKDYEDVRFKIVQRCFNVYDRLKLKKNLIYLSKPELCKRKEFDYVVAIFN